MKKKSWRELSDCIIKHVDFGFFILHLQADQSPNACECHVCKQEASGLTASALATGRLPAGHQFMNPEKPAHPALHLYPHIHGHIPLHTIPHLPRPLIHPTLYTASPFTHNKVSLLKQPRSGPRRNAVHLCKLLDDKVSIKP